MQQLTLRQFEVFLAVARAKSFRRAAEALHLSQPALSQHVAELERALGARLFDRLGRSVTLTEAGRILEDHALHPGEECLAAGLLDELVLIVPPGHRLARRRAVAPAVLADQRLLLREEGSATRQVTERALQHAGVRFAASMELGHTEAIKQAVMAGLGVAFVSVHAARGEVASRRLCALRLKGARIRRHFHVIHNEARTLSPSARAFIDLLEATRMDAGEAGARRSRG